MNILTNILIIIISIIRIIFYTPDIILRSIFYVFKIRNNLKRDKIYDKSYYGEMYKDMQEDNNDISVKYHRHIKIIFLSLFWLLILVWLGVVTFPTIR